MDTLHDYCGHTSVNVSKDLLEVFQASVLQELPRLWVGIPKILVDDTII